MEAVLRALDEEGYVVRRGVLEDECVDAVRRECAALVHELALRLLREGRVTDTFPNEPLETRLLRLYERHPDENPTIFRAELHREGFFGLFAHPALVDIAERALGPEVRLYPNYSVRPKLPQNARTEVLWHQDAGYTGAEAGALRMVNVWTPLVPATRANGCMEFIPRSHRRGVVPHERDLYYLRIRDDIIASVAHLAVPIELEPGDVVLFSNLLFHRGLPNRSNHIRWSVDFRYQDATQDTMRQTQGHLLRSRSRPGDVVRDARHWAALRFA
jgi:ectoine hydroxylase-related dioxygenase (phytanoyl-CoA dioxygenase family)